jgi:DNA polymerase III delta prime subunit
LGVCQAESALLEHIAVNVTMQKASTESEIGRLFNDTRKRLVETGTRNRLVHVNRSNTRGNVLNIVDGSAEEIHAFLSNHGSMRFSALGHDNPEGAGEIRLTLQDDASIAAGSRTETVLKTRLGPDALQKKLLRISGEAQTAEEESGVNILYLAVGFLTWFEDKSSSLQREAPLLLLPIELVRNKSSSTYNARLRDDDVMTNLPLQQRLLDDFGVSLPELEIEEGWKPTLYFEQVKDAVQHQARWAVAPDAIQLGFFSFSKLLMYRDLAIDAWPDDALSTHALTRGLLYEGFAGGEPAFGACDRLDDVLPPEKLFHVVDADGSQAKVIEEVRLGRNLVVQGPPGTGKSQTITNIIATAVKEGKRVLFLAEKMAALSVVHERLVKVGLRDVCLELHSRSANKKTMLAELRRTISQASAVPGLPGAPTRLKEARDRLNGLAEVLHRPIGATGETPFSVLGLQARFIGAGVKPPFLKAAVFASMTRSEEANLLKIIERLSELHAGEAMVGRHPFEGVGNLDLQPVELARIAELLVQSASAAEELAQALRDVLSESGAAAPVALTSVQPIIDLLRRLDGLPAESASMAREILHRADPARVTEMALAGSAWRTAHNAALSTFADVAFASTVSHLRGPIAAGASSFFTRWGSAYRAASRELAGLLRGVLPRRARGRVELVDRLVTLGAQRSAWESDAKYCAQVISDAWRGDRSDFNAIAATGAWCQRVSQASIRGRLDDMMALATTPDAIPCRIRALLDAEATAIQAINEVVELLNLDARVFGVADIKLAPLDAVSGQFRAMSAVTGQYANWSEMARLTQRLAAAGLAELAARMRAGVLDGKSAAAELSFARAETLWGSALATSPVLRDIRSQRRHELVADFAALERQQLTSNVTSILAAHLAQLPQGAQGEIGVIRGEIGKKTRHMAIRRLFERAGTAVQRIKPVLLMSPISVAQFLPPARVSFDLLVIDEASQVRPEDALGAIARAAQIVVVGDQKQLPPSSFFERLAADDENVEMHGDDGEDLLGGGAKLGDMESILTLCEARGLAPRMLQWHYRSRDPSLIAVSNREFYDGELILPPSPLEKDPAYGLCFTRVDGVYDRGGKRDNRLEGEAVVRRIAEHARTHPTLSLGVVTFSFAQRNLITELLEYARRSDTILDDFLRQGQVEDIFVKNIENVQGDERDVILISVGYGPAIAGGRLTSMSFGPVNSDGGERRLNVLFTRARVRCEIFASFDPGDIDVSRTAGAGPRILKRFLDYAKNGQLEERMPTGMPTETPFEDDVAMAIRTFGYLADPQVGSAGFRIDLGIRHPDRPGTYILAVECDGATYHSALWARERDRLRQDVLEHLGWVFHRIWSSDWFYNRQVEIERLRKALLSAKEATELGIQIKGANSGRPPQAEPDVAEDPPADVAEPMARQMPPYKRAVFPISTPLEPHEAPTAMVSHLARRIVDAEGPIHIEEIARRLAACFNKEKAGSRILAATRDALSPSAGNLLCEGDFWFTQAQSQTPPVRDRSAENGATLKASNISMLEISEALRIARDDMAGGSNEDLIRTAARLLGYRRVGADLQSRIASGLR